MHKTTARTALALWPPDDTEESVLGPPLHQGNIATAINGLKDAADAATVPGQDPPWQASGQNLILGLCRPDGTRYDVLPDVFAFRRPFDVRRPSLALAQDGPSALVIEVLSRDTWKADVNLERGKGWAYATAGVAEYLILDPAAEFIGASGRGWRLEGGVYAPWLPDEQGRWISALGPGFGFEGIWLVVYTADGQPVPGPGRILRSVAAAEARGLAAGEARGLVAGQLRALTRVLARRFGPLSPELEARLAALTDPAAVESLTDLAMDVSDLAAFVEAL